MLQTKDTDWLNRYKNKTHICCLQETHYKPQDTYRLKVRGWKNIFHANGKQKKVRVAILTSDKIDHKIKITRDKQGHYRMIKESIQEEDITIVNIYALNKPANLENSAVATGLEKVSFHSNPKERQCQRMLKLPHDCTHLTH